MTPSGLSAPRSMLSTLCLRDGQSSYAKSATAVQHLLLIIRELDPDSDAGMYAFDSGRMVVPISLSSLSLYADG